jgi:hypothetical protein
MFNKELFIWLKISKFQSSHYRNVSGDPVGTGRGSLGIAEHSFGTTGISCSQWPPSKVWVYSPSLNEIVGSNSSGGMDVSIVSDVSRQVEVFAWGSSRGVLTSVLCLSVIVKPR